VDERTQDLIGDKKICNSHAAAGYEPATGQTLGKEAPRGGAHRWATCRLSSRHTPRRSANTRRDPRLLVSVSQGHAPHAAELHRLQTLHWAWSTVPANPPPPRGEPSEPRQPQQHEEGRVELSRALIGRSTSYSEAMGHEKAEGSKSSMIGRSWWPRTMLRPLTDGRNTR
jgi:hypothetical protein